MSAPPRTLTLDGESLTAAALEEASRGGVPVRVAAAARRRMAASRGTVERILAGDRVVYGVNTGFGALASTRVERRHLDELQHNLIRSHCTGVGPPYDPPTTRAIVVVRANTLAKGYSGIRPEVVERLLQMLEDGMIPLVPQKGSVGASGDLAPLAHLVAPLLGEGQVWGAAGPVPAAEALRRAGRQPLRLEPREGLALINGTAAMTAQGVLALRRAERLARLADVAAAVAVEGLRGTARAFDERLHRARGQEGQIASASNLRALLGESEIMASHRDCGQVQDAYALRCVPQVHGAVRDTLGHASRVLHRELNAATDNPLIFADDDDSVSGGNFHGAPVGHVLDAMAVAAADLASLSERRLNRLVHPGLSRLPPFLVGAEPGLHSGLMLVQVTAAALVAENKILAHPASVDSIPTSADTEDHVSMGTHAARKAMECVENAETVLALELLAGAQAIHLLEPLRPSRGVAAAVASIRERVPPLAGDRLLQNDITEALALVRSGALLAAVEAAVGELR